MFLCIFAMMHLYNFLLFLVVLSCSNQFLIAQKGVGNIISMLNLPNLYNLCDLAEFAVSVFGLFQLYFVTKSEKARSPPPYGRRLKNKKGTSLVLGEWVAGGRLVDGDGRRAVGGGRGGRWVAGRSATDRQA